VELHGGAVDASSAGAERGASFVVRLPAIAQPALASAAGGEVRTVARRRILVVEDNDDARETLRVLLAAEGHDVCACADGAAALEALAAFTPEVAIVDIGLPEMDGYAVARALRERLGAGVRLIALTGYGLADDRRRAADAGFDAHLVKPAEHASLAAAIAGAAPQEAGLAA
jgi:CheY-like chemotaxis protein